MNQDQQPRPWWRDKRLVWALAALVLAWLLMITILFPFLWTTILSLFPWQSWDWRWLALLGLTFLSAGILYLTMRRGWNRLFDLTGCRGKTLWDWMGLLIVPLFLAGATLVFSIFELQREERRVINQQEIEADRARESVLQSYIQNMTNLLLDKGLATSDPTHPVRSIARSSTLTAIRQLDGDRKVILLQFLYESNLIQSFETGANNPIIQLGGTDLSGVDLSGAELFDAALPVCNLSGANLSGAFLIGTDLILANLSGANLSGALLVEADLLEANLSGAILSGAILVDANLRDATGWTNHQLAQAESLVGATMPDGTVMTEEAWEEFKKQYRQSSQP